MTIPKVLFGSSIDYWLRQTTFFEITIYLLLVSWNLQLAPVQPLLLQSSLETVLLILTCVAGQTCKEISLTGHETEVARLRVAQDPLETTRVAVVSLLLKVPAEAVYFHGSRIESTVFLLLSRCLGNHWAPTSTSYVFPCILSPPSHCRPTKRGHPKFSWVFRCEIFLTRAPNTWGT